MKGNPNNNIVKYVENDRNVTKYKHTVNDSELIRAIEAIDSSHTYTERYGSMDLTYIEGLISVNVGYNVPKHNQLNKSGGIIVLQHWRWEDINKDKTDSEGEELPPKYKLVQCLDEENKPITERFKRVIVGSGHNTSDAERLKTYLDKVVIP